MPPLIFRLPRSGIRLPAAPTMVVSGSSAIVHSLSGVDSLAVTCRFLFTFGPEGVDASEYRLLPR